ERPILRCDERTSPHVPFQEGQPQVRCDNDDPFPERLHQVFRRARGFFWAANYFLIAPDLFNRIAQYERYRANQNPYGFTVRDEPVRPLRHLTAGTGRG